MKYTLLFVFMYVFCLTACTSDDGEKAAARLELSATNFSIVQGGGEETVSITATAAWNIECKANWIHFAQTEGEGNGSVAFTVKENTGAEERSVVVKVTSGSKIASFYVSQDGKGGALTITPSGKQADSSGETFTVQVDGKGLEWECEIPLESVNWISYSDKQESSLKLTVKLNNSKNKRTANIRFKLKNGGSSKVMTVAQEAFQQSDIAGKKWLSLALKQPDSWYATNEAVEVAENVLLYQRNLGGWPKNIEMHLLLTDSEKKQLESDKSKQDAIFDNDATTTEMRFLAKMYKHIPDERYRTAFAKGLDYIISAQYPTGGWPQFYPLKGTYSDNITFNDDLMVNLLRLIKEVAEDKGDMEAIVENTVADKAKTAYDKGVQCILDCQVRDDDGKRTFWCAQHDPQTLEPAYGRPHEFPSYSGAEGARVLEFLMEIENPSVEVKESVIAAVEWLQAHKIPNKKVVDIKEGNTVVNRVVQDAPGEDMWGRFIQLGGTLADKVYADMIGKLANSKRTMTIDGKKVTFYYGQNVRDSYKKENAYQPVFGIYDADRAYLLYRFLYTYEDAPFESIVQDGVTLQIPTSLDAENRKNYQYLGNWPQKAIKQLYPAWRAKNGY